MTPSRPAAELEKLMIDAIRVLSMDAVQKAESGHPGTPMALAPAGYELFTRHLRHNPANPGWMDRDRFVLSVGHASMLIYSLLHLSGYDMPLEEIRDFRQWGSRTPGHPEVHHTPGIETTTGPLGQGVANSVGMALAERWLAHRFNRPGHEIVDHHTWAFCSDGDLMEGISHEVATFAGHQRLGKLVWVFDDNEITIEGSTSLSTSTDQGRRFESYGWHVLRVGDGEDLEALDEAFRAARAETERPTLIVMSTVIGHGSPEKAGTADAHGSPLGEDEVIATKKNLGYPSLEPFWVDDDARAEWRKAVDRGREMEDEWDARFAAYRDEHPELAGELERVMRGELPSGWDAEIPEMNTDAATRASSGKVLNAIAKRVPELVGGSADLGGSNKTDISGGGDLLADDPDGRIVHFGIREHGMGGIMNGMSLHGGVRPFGGTFLIFSDYMRPAMRLAALMEQPITYVLTHDSIGLGEDGPTHQPVEHLMALRAIHNLMDLRPGDGAETAEAWRAALGRDDGPAFLALTRQSVPALDRTGGPDGLAGAEGLHRGGYVLAEAAGGEPRCVLVASGSELHIAVEARARLQADGIPTRVVSLPSWYIFQRQDPEYRDAVLPPDVPAKVSVEAGITLGWERWIGSRGRAVGIDRFGSSAPWEVLYREFGLTGERVAEVAAEVVAESASTRSLAGS